MIKIRPRNKTNFDTAQSVSAFLPKLPARIIVAGPSGTGKGVLVSSLLLDPQLYKGAFSKIYYFSGSATLDHSLEPLKEYAARELRQGKDDPCLRDGWDEKEVARILEKQRKVVEIAKNRNLPEIPGICIVCDDLADDRKTMQGSMLQTLFTRGRHFMATCVLMSQRLRLMQISCRCNASALICFRLRNLKDLEAVIEESSALADKETLLGVYNHATRDKYGFLYIDLMQADPNLMFFKNFDSRLRISE